MNYNYYCGPIKKNVLLTNDLQIVLTSIFVIFFRDVVKNDEFLFLSPEQVVMLFSSDELTVTSEEKVFKNLENMNNYGNKPSY